MYVNSQIRRLEKTYPSLSPELSSTPALRSPGIEGIRTPHVDVYSAKVPLKGLLSTVSHDGAPQSQSAALGDSGLSLEERWAGVFMQSRAMRLEGKMAGMGKLSQGALGENGFQPGRDLLSGIMRVLRAPGAGTPLLVEWRMPEHLPRFFEKLAAWGYPWRLMEGGRHEWTVGSGGGEAGDEVEVRFASAHDYKVIAGEGGEGKVIPKWVQTLHRAYARFLLDEAVKEVRTRAAQSK